jgi:hypothetical protein
MLLSLVVFAVPPARAEEGKEAPPFQISGFVDTYYSYNFNNPQNRLNGLSNFDFNHNAFSLSLAELVVSKTAEPVGFRMDLDFGETTDFVHGGTSTTEAEIYKNIQQAYVTWATPIGLTVDFGKFVTHMGAEVIESKDNWNYTRSLLFCCAIPYYHAGVRANYVVNSMLYVNGYLYNGWNDVLENNNMKTGGIQVAITPIPQVPIILEWIGPEQGAGFKKRHVYEAIVGLNPTDTLSFMADYNYGTQDLVGGGSLKWSGIAAYARWKKDPCAFALRYEYTDDEGFMYGGGKNQVQEVTLTAEHTIAKNLLTRVEFRHDMSDDPIAQFQDDNGNAKDNQSRVVLGLVYTF